MPNIAAGTTGTTSVAYVGLGGGIRWTWTVSLAASGSPIIADTANPGGWAGSVDNNDNPTLATVSVPGAAAAGDYKFHWVGQLVGGGFSKKIFNGFFTVPAALAIPGAPTGCAAVPAFVTPSDSSNTCKVTATWAAPTTGGAVATYSVFRGGTLLASGVAGTTYTDFAVGNNQSCVYTVKAINAAGTSGPSNEGKAKAPTVPPSALVITCVGSSFNFVWTAPPGAVAYNVSRSAANLGGFALVSSLGAVSTHIDAGRPAATIFYYRLTALNTEVGFNTIESKVSNIDSALWLAAPTVTAGWGLERNDNTKPKSRHLRVVDLAAGAVNGSFGYVSPLALLNTVCPAAGAPGVVFGTAPMPAAPAALSVRLTEGPLTPDPARLDYFTMTAGTVHGYFQVTIGSPVGLAAKVITSLCTEFEIPVYTTGRRTYYDVATRTLVNERSPTRQAIGTIWQKIKSTRRDWLAPNGKKYRDTPKRRKHS